MLLKLFLHIHFPHFEYKVHEGRDCGHLLFPTFSTVLNSLVKYNADQF